MNLAQFLSKSSFFDDNSSATVLYFKGSQDAYPLLFFSILCNRIKQNIQIPVAYIDVAQEDFNNIQSKLETSFLGQASFYWLKSAVDIDEKKRKQLISYLSHYQGPNSVGVFVPLELSVPQDAVEIIVDPLIDQKTFVLFMKFLDANSNLTSSQLIVRVFKQNETIPLDTACLLMHYARVLGSNSDYFISSWLEKILTPEKSLFTLSTYFFAKKANLFFKEWARIHAEYSEQFWIAFWSEQLWRAYHYVEYSRLKQFTIAKKIAHRLPFTFMQRDWQQFQAQELSEAHQFIYDIDCALKNGAQATALDVFYSKFFLGAFK